MKNEDIDEYLISLCDLGYLLDYLKKRKLAADPYLLPIIDVLRLSPGFEEEVVKIREKLSISPEDNVKKLESRLNRSNLSKVLKEHARGIKYIDLEDQVLTSIDDFTKSEMEKCFPNLSKRIAKLRLSTFGRLLPSWHYPIAKYILFNFVDITPLKIRRSTPQLDLKIDSKTEEPYVEIRIYADTNISNLKQVQWWKKAQKTLTNYLSMEKTDDDITLRRFFHFVLREKMKLPHQEIQEWFKQKGFIFNEADFEHAAQEVIRFKNLLYKSIRSHIKHGT